eukprot:7290430-Ditylum_brightwellii.AAC.1
MYQEHSKSCPTLTRIYKSFVIGLSENSRMWHVLLSHYVHVVSRGYKGAFSTEMTYAVILQKAKGRLRTCSGGVRCLQHKEEECL